MPVPATVLSDGSDVTTQLVSWLNGLPAGAIAKIPAGTYGLAGTVRLANKQLTISADGATFRQLGPGPDPQRDKKGARTRCMFSFTDSSITFLDGQLVGAHERGGANGSYVAALEAQHGIELLGCRDTIISGTTVSYVYGDGFYLGIGDDWCDHVLLDRVAVDHTGRQGISVTAARHATIIDSKLDEVRRSFFDLEPASSLWGVDGLTVARCDVGASRLGLFPSLGKGFVGNVDVIALTTHTAMHTPAVKVDAGDNHRRGPFRFVDCTISVQGSTEPAMQFVDVDGISFEGCRIAMPASRKMTAVKAIGCTDVDLGNETQFVGHAHLLAS